jgi:hypothetical protein
VRHLTEENAGGNAEDETEQNSLGRAGVKPSTLGLVSAGFGCPGRCHGSRLRFGDFGAGVVVSAWYLAWDGHEVTVTGRQQEAGMEASFANGGQISVSHADTWANPVAQQG